MKNLRLKKLLTIYNTVSHRRTYLMTVDGISRPSSVSADAQTFVVPQTRTYWCQEFLTGVLRVWNSLPASLGDTNA